jgi:membrane fusion protein, copper/silver efflux system
MRFVKSLLIAGVGLAVLIAGYQALNHKPHAAHVQGEKDVYYCPMHPDYTSDRPGTCPICNMNLVKRKPAGDQSKVPAQTVKGYAPVTLDVRQQQLLGIKTVKAQRKPVTHDVQAVATVAHGIDLYKVQDEYIKAYREYITTYRDYRRIQGRRKIKEEDRQVQLKVLEAEHELVMLGLSEEQIAKLRDLNWWELWNQPELMMFKETENYWVLAQIFERDLGFVTVGQAAEIEIPSYHEKIQGVVRAVGGAIDPETRTARAIIEIQKYRGELAANMLAYVSMKVDLDMNLVVPRQAVMDLGGRKIVFVEQGEGIFEPVEVQVGFQNEEYWSVLKGLKEGQKVVANGNFLLDSESRLRSQLSGAQSAQNGGAHAGH